jgi:hypothetical protein
MNQVISYGAGVNSTAMAIMLINQGWKGQIVFSDTGCEWPETYCFMDYFEREWLKPRGFEIIRIKGKPYHRLAGGISLIEYCETHHKIPMAAVRWCTMDYKVRALGYWCELNGNPEQLIGIAADESHRKPESNRPLVDASITREGCYKIIEAEGLSVPRKSGCYICPFQRPSGWKQLWQEHRELFERAARLEESTVRDIDGRYQVTLDPAGKITLRQRQHAFEHQIPMFDQVDYDDLLRFKPCICELGEE